ncbi:hypothetical protein HELRODRAFT_91019, partial [Helobdella robusta]|uniref:ABC transporter domain-containing protein n=1 Tax=Helobdella robusta TaxID=6412 RepID=T1G7Y7_HELRO
KLVAVNGVSFGTRRGECFGLLGVNGAGKSTLFKMITGEICPTSGYAIVDGSSIMSNRSSALRKFGYCPQTEALCPLMNVQEHLFLFARLRGISFQNIKNVVEWGLRHMGLRNYSKQLPSKLSGGNRRKLQVTLAIIGNPQLICLDEPTTGVDPRARRYVWECISGSSTIDHGVLLTTHSMEESESLCHKLTIMLSGQLVCFGNLQHIKSKFSRGYTINLKMYNLTAEENKKAATEIDDFIASSFNDAVLTSKNFNVVQYQAPIMSSQLGSVFDKLSHGKNKKLFEDFSISQTTLEQVGLWVD